MTKSTGKSSERLVLRYEKPQRIAHWMFVSAFVTLLITGFIVFLPWTSHLAVGGWIKIIHRIAAVVFILVPVYYPITHPSGFLSLLRDSFPFNRDTFGDDVKFLLAMPLYIIGKAHNLPPQDRLNAGERLHHFSVFIFATLSTITGLVLWFGRIYISSNLFMIAVILHDISMIILVFLTLGHVYFSIVYGAIRGMTTGYVTETYAKVEHSVWLKKMEKEGKVFEPADIEGKV